MLGSCLGEVNQTSPSLLGLLGVRCETSQWQTGFKKAQCVFSLLQEVSRDRTARLRCCPSVRARSEGGVGLGFRGG